MGDEPKIIRYLPEIYQAQEEGFLFNKLLSIFAQELEEIESAIKSVIASHTSDFADKNGSKIDDLARLGALFEIKPKVDEPIEDFRERLKESVKLYLDGLSTAEAVIRMTALHFGYRVNKIERFNLATPFFATAKLVDKNKSTFEIEVRDNPPQFVSSQREVVNGEDWDACNNGLFEVRPSMVITSLHRAVVNPQISNFTTGQVVGYMGVIPEGKSLVINVEAVSGVARASLDGRDVTENLFFLKGESFDSARFDLSRFAQVGDSLILPRGRSRMRYSFSAARFDFGFFDQSAFYQKDAGEFDESLFDQAIFAPEPPDARLTFRWQEHRMATFWLKLPYELLNKEIPFFKGDITRSIISDINLVKAAGVRAIIYTVYGCDENEDFIQRQTLTDTPPVVEIRSGAKEDTGLSDGLNNIHIKNRLRDAQQGSDRLIIKGAFDLTRFDAAVFV